MEASRRAARGVGEEEDASQGRLGADFTNAECLLIAEVAAILESKQEESAEAEPTNVYRKTADYVKRFNRYKNRAAVNQVRDLLSKKNLTQYEMACLGNLCPEKAEEAKALIPSLEAGNRFTDEELDALLAELANLRKIV